MGKQILDSAGGREYNSAARRLLLWGVTALLGVGCIVALLMLIRNQDTGISNQERAVQATTSEEVKDPAASRVGEPAPQTGSKRAPAQSEATKHAAQPEAIIVRVVSNVGAPIPQARAYLPSMRSVRPADKDGAIAFHQTTPLGLVYAEGYLPATVEARYRGQTVELRTDPGLEVRVIWQRSQLPVEGATITRGGFVSKWHADALDALGLLVCETDFDGTARLRALSIDGDTQSILVTHPDGVAVVESLYDSFSPNNPGTTSPDLLTIAMPDFLTSTVIRVLDAQDQPKANAKVTIHKSNLELTQETNDAGEAHFNVLLDPAEISGVRPIVIDVQSRDSEWKWREVSSDLEIEIDGTLVVRYSPKQVHVLLGEESVAGLEVASAAVLGQEYLGLEHRVQPRLGDLDWAPAVSSRMAIRRGWQGRETCIVMRARSGSYPLAVGLAKQHAADDTALIGTLVPPLLCALTIKGSNLPLQAEFGLELIATTGEGRLTGRGNAPMVSTMVKGTQLTISVPRSNYVARVTMSGSVWVSRPFDASGEQCVVDLGLGKTWQLSGKLTGGLMGPMPGVHLYVLSQDGRLVGEAVSDHAGQYVLRVAEAGSVTVHPQWKGKGNAAWAQSIGKISCPGGEDCVRDIRRPESQLIFARSKEDLSLEELPIVVEYYSDSQAKFLKFDSISSNAELEASRMIVPAGRVRISRKRGGVVGLTEALVVADQGDYEVPVMALEAGAIEVVVPLNLTTSLDSIAVRVLDENGVECGVTTGNKRSGNDFIYKLIAPIGQRVVEARWDETGENLIEEDPGTWRTTVEVGAGSTVRVIVSTDRP